MLRQSGSDSGSELLRWWPRVRRRRREDYVWWPRLSHSDEPPGVSHKVRAQPPTGQGRHPTRDEKACLEGQAFVFRKFLCSICWLQWRGSSHHTRVRVRRPAALWETEPESGSDSTSDSQNLRLHAQSLGLSWEHLARDKRTRSRCDSRVFVAWTSVQGSRLPLEATGGGLCRLV
jgi:hypothetical protein